MTWEIYLDVDGVCADFIGPALDAIGLDRQVIESRWVSEFAGQFYPEELLGRPAATLFQDIDQLGAGFWSALPAYDWFPQLYQDLSKFGTVIFLTAPTGYPDCLAGKYQWLCQFFGEGFRDCVFTEHKDRLAHTNAILIDDSDNNIVKFRRRGGRGVLFPQYWNSKGPSPDPLEDILTEVSAIIHS